MLTALLIILDGSATWEKLGAIPKHRVWRVFFGYLAPILLLTIAVESYSLLKFGLREGEFVTRVVKPSQDLVIRYETIKTGLDLFIIFAGAWMLQKMGQGFHRKHSYSESFAALGYSLGPFFLARLLGAVPSINSWIPYTIGILLAVSALYKGIPRIMKPDPSNALGLYIMTSLGLIVVTGLAHFLRLQVLDQNILHKGFTF